MFIFILQIIFLFFICFYIYFYCFYLNDIHVYSKTTELELGQILQYEFLEFLIKLKGMLGEGHQYRSLALCVYISSKASHIPVVQYLSYSSTTNF